METQNEHGFLLVQLHFALQISFFDDGIIHFVKKIIRDHIVKKVLSQLQTGKRNRICFERFQ
jgi:hypothetical protein